MNKKLNTESVRQQLNSSTAKLDLTTLTRLQNVRMKALARYDARSVAPVFVLAGTGHASNSHSHRHPYFLASVLLLAVLLFSGAVYWQHVTELDNSDVDIAILTGDLPIAAYVD